MTKLVFIFLFLFSSFAFSQNTKNELYNLGVKHLTNGNYLIADSIFTLAINSGDSNKDTYFNRALARKKLGNVCGYCVDLIFATSFGDIEASSIFWKNCPKKDSIFACIENIKVAIKDSTVGIRYFNSQINVERITKFNSSGKLISSFATDGKDTVIKNYSSEENDTIYDLVAIQYPPKFPGGDENMLKFLANNTHYPSHSKNKGIQGKVYVTFIIDEFGNVTNISLYKGINGGEDINEEALRVVRIMPKWEPGKQNGKQVKVRFILPLAFKLGY